MLVDVVNKFLSIMVVGSQVFIVLSLLYAFLGRKKGEPLLPEFFSKNALWFALSVAILAMAGSLFYSEIAHYTPCKLCWYERILMYPQVLLIGMALWKKDKKIADYGLGMSILGFLIALYHNYIYYTGNSLFPCDAAGLGESCTRRFILEFGYVTIPLMALTAFALLIVLFAALRSTQKAK